MNNQHLKQSYIYTNEIYNTLVKFLVFYSVRLSLLKILKTKFSKMVHDKINDFLKIRFVAIWRGHTQKRSKTVLNLVPTSKTLPWLDKIYIS